MEGINPYMLLHTGRLWAIYVSASDKLKGWISWNWQKSAKRRFWLVGHISRFQWKYLWRKWLLKWKRSSEIKWLFMYIIFIYDSIMGVFILINIFLIFLFPSNTYFYLLCYAMSLIWITHVFNIYDIFKGK